MLKHCLALILTFIIPTAAYAGQVVEYTHDETVLEGYWSESTCDDPLMAPLILIVHQWKGLGEYEKSRADMLAEECYNAFSIDMYGKGVRPANREEAAAESSKYKGDSTLARARLKAAYDYALRRYTEKPKAAIMGYCFGGTMALEMARAGVDIDGAVSFHGGLSTQKPATTPGVITASVQVHHGADDPYVKKEEVDAFIDEMNVAEADWHFIAYADAVHAFTEEAAGNDPSKGVAYNEKADKRSWASTLLFFDELLRQ